MAKTRYTRDQDGLRKRLPPRTKVRISIYDTWSDSDLEHRKEQIEAEMEALSTSLSRIENELCRRNNF